MEDIDMMDEDLAVQAPVATELPKQTDSAAAPVPEAYYMDLDDIGKTTPEKIHVHGVDDMTTEQVTAWADGHTASADVKLKKVEWIDDSSCNLIYESKEFAGMALELLTLGEPSKEQVEDRLIFRNAKNSETHTAARLRVRVAKDTDKKQKGARERSRFYLFNPEYDRAEQAERRKKERGGDRRRRGRDDLENGDYEKRRFDDREHRRRRDDEGEDFDAGMYDDEPGASGASRRDRRPPRRSRDRSISPGGYRRDNYRRRSRSRSPALKKEAIELFPQKVRSNNARHGLLAGVAVEYDAALSEPVPTPIMDESALEPRREERDDRPARSFASRMGLPIKGASGQQEPSQPSAGRSLADRIEFPAKSLSERISFPENDLFADKMRNAERSHNGRLNIDSDEGSGGGRRRPRNRRRAHEMFGEE